MTPEEQRIEVVRLRKALSALFDPGSRPVDQTATKMTRPGGPTELRRWADLAARPGEQRALLRLAQQWEAERA